MNRIHVLIIVLFATMGLYAQETKHDKTEDHYDTHNKRHDIDSEAHAMMYADKMTTRLNLNLEQKQRIQQAEMTRLMHHKEMMARMMNEYGNMGSDNAGKQMEKSKIQDEFKAEMKRILSASQYKEWEPMHEREMKMHSKDSYKTNDSSRNKNKPKEKDKNKKQDKNDDN